MLASEVIKKLQKFVDDNLDCEVRVNTIEKINSSTAPLSSSHDGERVAQAGIKSIDIFQNKDQPAVIWIEAEDLL